MGDGSLNGSQILGKVIPTTGPITFLALATFDTTSNGANDEVMGFGARAFFARTSAGDRYQFLTWNGTGFDSATTAPFAATRQFRTDLIIARHSVGTGSTNVIDAIDMESGERVTGSGSATTRTSATLWDMVVGGEVEDGRYFNGSLYLAAVWNRRISDGDVRSLQANPWQLFAPQARVWVPGATTSALALEQSRFRWRNDDGSETAATWAAAADTDITAAALTPKRLRVQVAATGDPSAKAFKLQYRKVGDADWKDVN